MRTIWNDLFDLFFPRQCLLCKTPLVKGEEHICIKCQCDLPYTRFSDRDNAVAQLFTGTIPIAEATAFLYFEQGGHSQTLIHALKYHDNRKLGYYLGRLAALELVKNGKNILSRNGGPPPDFLIPVPLHPQKQRQRGYNQSEWIARGMYSVLGVPVDTTSVRRIRSNETQARKQLYDRRKNVRNIFVLDKTTHLQGKHILLIDDVITTGSTIGACAETLSAIPDIRINILGLAVTKH